MLERVQKVCISFSDSHAVNIITNTKYLIQKQHASHITSNVYSKHIHTSVTVTDDYQVCYCDYAIIISRNTCNESNVYIFTNYCVH